MFELLWRDYFRFNAMKLKAALFNRISPYSENLCELDQLKLFQAWYSGQSPDAFINANMQELNQTGWMSNRGRQNVASYLVKTLHVNWQWGASYFEKKLLDYDAASNWGNWAYLAGVGQDPRDRIFNSERQAQRYDPMGKYQKKWLLL
jgi:deoxyribodipyrimidine photo-lyase